MKAAVMFRQPGIIQYTDVAEPIPQNADEILVRTKAVAMKHFDKSRATGQHYSRQLQREEGQVIGGDGICLLPGGERVYAIGVSGMVAEKAVIDKRRMVLVPEALPDAIAAALPNAIIGAAMALRFKANIEPGDVVLVNGATGFTGRVAVQVAKLYGSAKVIATGRNAASLQALLALGADEVISLAGNDQDISGMLAAVHAANHIDVVIDYLWGAKAAIIFDCLKGDGSFSKPTRYVSVGSVAGDIAPVSAAALRSTNLHLNGSGLGAWSKEEVTLLFSEILPAMFQYAVEGRLKTNIVTRPVKDIASVWEMELAAGQRLVILI